MAGIDDVVTKLQVNNQTNQQIANTLANWFPRGFGAFTLSAAASTVVTDSRCTSASYIIPIPTNAAAGTLQGSAKCLYTTYANGSFTVHTSSGVAAAGTETFQYVLFVPL